MTVIPPVGAGSPDAGTQASTAGKNSTLDKDGFLKLFVAQLQHQDPTSPMDASESTQQMASFSMVEQLTNMASENTKIAQSLNQSNAVGLIGRTVNYTAGDKTTHTGVVEKVTTAKDGTPSLTVAGTDGVAPSSISQVS